MDLKALGAFSLERVDKGQLYEVYNHYFHHSVLYLQQDKKTAMSAPVLLQTWNEFEIDPS